MCKLSQEKHKKNEVVNASAYQKCNNTHQNVSFLLKIWYGFISYITVVRLVLTNFDIFLYRNKWDRGLAIIGARKQRDVASDF